VLLVAGVYVACGTISTTTWTMLGQQIRRVLRSPGRLRAFNRVMALLLVATLVPVLWPV
jgi:threonine/homoserine/homoserine lactone efflux protein